MTMSFPLLKLPLIPLEFIIEQLDFLDLLQLSMKFSKVKRVLELLKLSVQSLNVFITERFYRIKILQNQCLLNIDACDSVPVDTVTELANIQGEPVQIWNHDRDEVKVKSDLSKLVTLEIITKYILTISKATGLSLTYNDAETEIRSLFIWQLTTQLYQFEIFPIHGDLVQISSEDLTFLLEGISVERLSLSVNCPGFKYQKVIRHPAIYISYPCWIDFYKFSLGPETITASFYDQKVSNPVLNRLINAWKEGKNPKLRAVLFKWEDHDGRGLAMVQEHEARPPKPILPNRNVEQLRGLSMKKLLKHHFWRYSVFYEVRLSVEDDLNGIP